MENIDGKISNLFHNARLQEYLLQTYRSFYLNLESILLVFATTVVVIISRSELQFFETIFLFLIICLFTFLGVYLSISFKKLIADRVEDVDECQQMIRDLEKDHSYKGFTEFWQNHESRNTDVSIRKILGENFFSVTLVLWGLLFVTACYFSFRRFICL